MVLAQASSNRIHFGLRLPQRDTLLQLADDVVVFVIPVLRGIRSKRKRKKDVSLFCAAQCR